MRLLFIEVKLFKAIFVRRGLNNFDFNCAGNKQVWVILILMNIFNIITTLIIRE